jgi:hypothetical protein
LNVCETIHRFREEQQARLIAAKKGLKERNKDSKKDKRNKENGAY